MKNMETSSSNTKSRGYYMLMCSALFLVLSVHTSMGWLKDIAFLMIGFVGLILILMFISISTISPETWIKAMRDDPNRKVDINLTAMKLKNMFWAHFFVLASLLYSGYTAFALGYVVVAALSTTAMERHLFFEKESLKKGT